jgi:hypothetical protein
MLSLVLHSRSKAFPAPFQRASRPAQSVPKKRASDGTRRHRQFAGLTLELSGGTKLAKPALARPLERRVRPVAKHTWTRLRTRSAAALAAHRWLLLTLKTTLAHATSPGAVSTCSASTVASHRFDQTLSAAEPANARRRVCIAPRRSPADRQRTGSPRPCGHAGPHRSEAFEMFSRAQQCRSEAFLRRSIEPLE